jgi:hypothetical protein
MPMQETLQNVRSHLQAAYVGLPVKEIVSLYRQQNSITPYEATSALHPNLASPLGLAQAAANLAVTRKDGDICATQILAERVADQAPPMPHRADSSDSLLISPVPSLIDSPGQTPHSPNLSPESHGLSEFDIQTTLLTPEAPANSKTSTLESGKGHKKGRQLLWKIKQVFKKSKAKTDLTHSTPNPEIPPSMRRQPPNLGPPGQPAVSLCQPYVPPSGATPPPPMHQQPFYPDFPVQSALYPYQIQDSATQLISACYPAMYANVEYAGQLPRSGIDSGYSTMANSTVPSPNGSPSPAKK